MFKNYDYKTPIKKLILNQFGACLLGIMLYMASGSTAWLTVATSIFCIIFYMVIIYTSMWDIGTKDRVKYDGQRLSKDYSRPVIAALIAGSVNIILGLLCTVFTAFDSMANSVVVLARNIAIMWESMYSGVLWYIFPKTDVGAYAVIENPLGILYMSLYLVIVLPAIGAALLGYAAGFNNFKIIKAKKKEK